MSWRGEVDELTERIHALEQTTNRLRQELSAVRISAKRDSNVLLWIVVIALALFK